MTQRHTVHDETGLCGECAHLTVVTDFHTLTVHGRKPTLGRCPYDTRCRLLSEKGCEKFKAAVIQQQT